MSRVARLCERQSPPDLGNIRGTLITHPALLIRELEYDLRIVDLRAVELRRDPAFVCL